MGSAFRRTSQSPADRLRQGYGGPPTLHAKAEAGHYVRLTTEAAGRTVAFREYATIVACERDAQGASILETKDQRLPYEWREIDRPDGVERTFDAVNAGDRNARHIVHTLISGYPITNLADDVALRAQVADARIFLDELHHSWGLCSDPPTKAW